MALSAEAKGSIVAYLTTKFHNNLVIRVAGCNAGHTVYGNCPSNCETDPGSIIRHGVSDHFFQERFIGHPWRLQQVPVAAVSDPFAELAIAAGSEINPVVLYNEITALESAGYSVQERLIIDSQATLLEQHHIKAEQIDQITERLGSTAKGVGAARADRIWRKAKTWSQYDPTTVCNVAEYALNALSKNYTVIIEGTQGFGLGLHAGQYPFTTSSNCRAIDFLAMAGISPWYREVEQLEIWLVARTRPIRVAGNSGALSGETSWENLGLPLEHTTVTRKVRRVGEWDSKLVQAAVIANGGPPVVRIAYTMLDHIFPDIVFQTDPKSILYYPDIKNHLSERQAACGAPIELVGTSPITIAELGDEISGQAHR